MKIMRHLAGISILAVIILPFGQELPAQSQKDPWGLKNKIFLIQSAQEVGKGWMGCWDLPGTRNFKDKAKLQAWKMDSQPIGKDRYFRFVPDLPGEYKIEMPYIKNRFGHSLCIHTDGDKNGTKAKVEFNHATRVRLKHMGRGRFKIIDVYSKKVFCLAGRSSGNGTAINLWDDHNGPWMEWVFWERYGSKWKVFVPKKVAGNDSNGSQNIGTIEKACMYKSPTTVRFFQSVSVMSLAGTKGDMVDRLNKLPTKQRFSVVSKIIKGTSKNISIDLRRLVFSELDRVNYQANGFFDATLKRGIKKQLIRVRKHERDSRVKNNMKSIIGKL